MSVYSGSSRNSPLYNPDGSVNVSCYVCGEFIAKTYQRATRAMCELCRRVETGEPLTDDVIRAYKMAKRDRVDVALCELPDVPPKTPIKKFTLRSMGGDILRALGVKRPVVTTRSQEIAKEKRKGRLFEGIDLGSMEQIDKLSKPKEK